MFMWFSVTEIYRWSGWTSIFICHLLMLTYFLCGKYSRISVLLLNYLVMLTIFHVQNVVIILNWCLCDFLLLKYIDEVDGLPSSFVTYWCWHIFCVENILEFQYCFWLFTVVDYFSCAKCSYHSWLMFMWFSVTEIYRWSGWTSIFICHLLMLTYFLCGKYSTISILLLII